MFRVWFNPPEVSPRPAEKPAFFMFVFKDLFLFERTRGRRRIDTRPGLIRDPDFRRLKIVK